MSDRRGFTVVSPRQISTTFDKNTARTTNTYIHICIALSRHLLNALITSFVYTSMYVSPRPVRLSRHLSPARGRSGLRRLGVPLLNRCWNQLVAPPRQISEALAFRDRSAPCWTPSGRLTATSFPGKLSIKSNFVLLSHNIPRH